MLNQSDTLIITFYTYNTNSLLEGVDSGVACEIHLNFPSLSFKIGQFYF